VHPRRKAEDQLRVRRRRSHRVVGAAPGESLLPARNVASPKRRSAENKSKVARRFASC
jgi:hypothetical protein